MLMLGEYKEIYNDDSLPSIHNNISLIEEKNKEDIIKYLKKGRIVACAAGKAVDVFTGDIIPDELSFQTDGKYEWRSDLVYYVKKYNLKLDQSFIDYVLNN